MTEWYPQCSNLSLAKVGEQILSQHFNDTLDSGCWAKMLTSLLQASHLGQDATCW